MSISQQVEQIREKLGYWGQSPTAPRYSVCVCNYNMADTLEQALGSVARQLDPTLYEIVVLDDGSSDESVSVLEKLARQYPHLRYIPLPRDSNRKLGETRNLSIRAARGEYIMVHIDADDEWEPHIQDFVTLFHKVEAQVGHDILLVGQQIGMGKRDFLLPFGPYQNVYRCEDRNMMMKLAKENLLYFMDYRVFRTRLSRPKKKKIIKIIRDLGSHLAYEMRQTEDKWPQIKYILTAPFNRVPGSLDLKTLLARALLVLPIYLITRFQPPIVNHMRWEELRDYHAAKRGTYAEVMTRLGGDPDLSFLNKEAQEIFTHNVKLTGFSSSR